MIRSKHHDLFCAEPVGVAYGRIVQLPGRLSFISDYPLGGDSAIPEPTLDSWFRLVVRLTS